MYSILKRFFRVTYFVLMGSYLFSQSVPSCDFAFETDAHSAIVLVKNQHKLMRIAPYQPDPIADNRLFHFGNGKITILLGTSTAGKTTLINQMKQMDPDLLDYGLDDRIRMAADKRFRKCALEEFRIISEVTHQFINDLACEGDSLKVKPDISDDQERAAKAALVTLKEKNDQGEFPEITELMVSSIIHKAYQKIVKQSQKGYSIVFDVVHPKCIYDFLNTNIIAPIEIKLVFCSLGELAKRLGIRNERAFDRGEFSNRRGNFALGQYTQLYRPRQNSNEPTLEILTRDQAEGAFDQHFYNKMDKKPLFLKSLGFISPGIEALEMTCRVQYYNDVIQ